MKETIFSFYLCVLVKYGLSSSLLWNNVLKLTTFQVVFSSAAVSHILVPYLDVKWKEVKYWHIILKQNQNGKNIQVVFYIFWIWHMEMRKLYHRVDP